METNQQLVDELGASLNRQLSWIAAIDNKVAPVFAIDVAMLGAISALAPEWGRWEIGAAFISALAAIGLLGSIGFLAAASFPQLKGPQQSMIFFGGIAGKSASEFAEKMKRGVTPEYLDDFLSQIHRNAEIALGKYVAVKKAMILMFASAPLFVFSVMMLYQISY